MRALLRCAIAIAPLSLSLYPSAAAQSPPDDALWIGGASSMQKLDRFGNLLSTVQASLRGPVFRAPNGELWTMTPANTVQIRDRAGTVRQTVAPAGRPTELAFDRAGNAWVAFSDRAAVERYSPAGQLVRTINTVGNGLAISIDSAGRVWVAQQNMPTSFLSSIDPTSGQLNTVTVPASVSPVNDIVTDFRGTAPSHVYVAGGAGNFVAELDQNGALVHTLKIGDDPTELFSQLAVDVRGDLFVLGRSALYRLDNSTGTARAEYPRSLLASFSLDATGGVWAASLGGLVRLDVDRHRLDLAVATQTVRMDDGAGYHFALAVDPFGDADGDGQPNAYELQSGTNPYDAQSNAAIDLSTARVGYRSMERVAFELDGLGGQALCLFGTSYRLGQPPLPGIAGEPRLTLAGLLPVTIPASVPGRIEFDIPANPVLHDKQLCAQPIFVGPALRFGNHTCIRIQQPVPQTIIEPFLLDAQLDKPVSSGTWANGVATPGLLGGTGIHGSFDPTLGERIAGTDIFVWSTDDMTIPASHTLFGSAIRVTDGRFQFTDFVLPRETTVWFRGSNPARLRVRGQVMIQGKILLDGADVPGTHNGKNSTLSGGMFTPGTGQQGSLAGAGGGRGGDGAFACDGTGNPLNPVYNFFAGFDGADVRLLAGHAYAAQAALTGGRGSLLFPPHGDRNQLIFRPLAGTYCGQTTSGGGGGGYDQPGQKGTAIEGGYIAGEPVNTNPSDLGPDTPGGIAFAVLPLPAGSSSGEHFLGGGSGGGGGGSHPLFANRNPATDPFVFWSGGAGAGGGGAVGFRVGSDFQMASTASLTAVGGSGGDVASSFTIGRTGALSPGGGGSGGSLVIQVGVASPSLGGVLDVRGGAGSRLNLVGFFAAKVHGGDGSPGYFRLEVPRQNPPVSLLGATMPQATARNVAELREIDAQVGFQSLWYDTSLPLAPEYLYYTLKVRVAGTTVTWTDDPQAFRPANLPGLPVRLYVQGANYSPAGQLLSGPGPWRDFVSQKAGASIGLDDATRFRFMVLFDRSVQRDVVVEEFSVTYR